MSPPLSTLRVARPTDQLDAIVQMYVDGLGFERLGGFADHDGFDGVMVGHPHLPYHFEFTHEHGVTVGAAPTEEHLLVFYVDDDDEGFAARCAQLLSAGFVERPPHNPYWARQGRTFADVDGYGVVLVQGRWPPAAPTPVS